MAPSADDSDESAEGASSSVGGPRPRKGVRGSKSNPPPSAAECLAADYTAAELEAAQASAPQKSSKPVLGLADAEAVYSSAAKRLSALLKARRAHARAFTVAKARDLAVAKANEKLLRVPPIGTGAAARRAKHAAFVKAAKTEAVKAHKALRRAARRLETARRVALKTLRQTRGRVPAHMNVLARRATLSPDGKPQDERSELGVTYKQKVDKSDLKAANAVVLGPPPAAAPAVSLKKKSRKTGTKSTQNAGAAGGGTGGAK